MIMKRDLLLYRRDKPSYNNYMIGFRFLKKRRNKNYSLYPFFLAMTDSAQVQEPLHPAFTRPAKEKSHQPSKSIESGENRRTPASSRTPAKPPAQPAPTSAFSGDDESEPSDSEYQTPSSESAPFFSTVDDNVRKPQSVSEVLNIIFLV